MGEKYLQSKRMILQIRKTVVSETSYRQKKCPTDAKNYKTYFLSMTCFIKKQFLNYYRQFFSQKLHFNWTEFQLNLMSKSRVFETFVKCENYQKA